MRCARSIGLVLIVVFPATGLAAEPPWIVRDRLGMVASDSPEASQIGAEVLARGGNAFDAAVATSFALAVARPDSTGLGGGGFMVAYVAKERRCVALDFREMAPVAATRVRYARLVDEQGDGPPPTIYGGNAVGVPGQLAGLDAIRSRWGSRPLAELVRPAIELAETGFVVDEHYRSVCESTLKQYRKYDALRGFGGRLYETLLNEGDVPALGSKVKRPDVAGALRAIAEGGPGVFYEGAIGEAIVTAVNAAGGRMTMKDLGRYQVIERTPIRGRFGDGELEVVSMPPPSSGGVCLVETLHILDALKLRSDLHPVRDRAYVLVEALKHAFADRARWLGDADFVPVPVARLTSRPYALSLAQRIEHKVQPPEKYGSHAPLPEDRGTSHFCVADRDGNVVALTETINGSFGSLVVAEPFGIILNNEMDDFAAKPGEANLYGLVQSEANAVAPGKRPLSSMSPTIVLRDGKPVLALGGSGGPKIITAVLQVMLHVTAHGKPLAEAVAALRLHHQWRPDELGFDQTPPASLVERFEAAGQKITDVRKVAIVQAIEILRDGTLVGASDPRKGGRPAGASGPGTP